MKGKGERLTYWLIGEDPLLRSKRSTERASKRDDSDKKATAGTGTNDPLVPRSSLKNKSLVRSTFTRCSSESPKRLRFASSDQLDQKAARANDQLESIADNSPCKASCASTRSSCMEGWRSSSNSCPCVEKLCRDRETETTGLPGRALLSPPSSANVPLLRTNLFFIGNESSSPCPPRKGLRLGTLQVTCRSAPSSPRHSTTVLNAQKRAAQSNEEIDTIPLICYPGGRLD